MIKTKIISVKQSKLKLEYMYANTCKFSILEFFALFTLNRKKL